MVKDKVKVSKREQVMNRCESLERFGYFMKCHQDMSQWSTPAEFNRITESELPNEWVNSQNLIVELLNFYCDILLFGECIQQEEEGKSNVLVERCKAVREEILKHGYDAPTLELMESTTRREVRNKVKKYNTLVNKHDEVVDKLNERQDKLNNRELNLKQQADNLVKVRAQLNKEKANLKIIQQEVALERKQVEELKRFSK